MVLEPGKCTWDDLFPRLPYRPGVMWKPPPCVNLEERFPQYQIFWEDGGSYKDQLPREEWPSIMEIHGKSYQGTPRAVVYPHGHDILIVESYTRLLSGVLRRLPFVLKIMGAFDEQRMWFHVDHAQEVFDLIKPIKSRSYVSRKVLQDSGRMEEWTKSARTRSFQKGEQNPSWKPELHKDEDDG